MEDPTFLEKLYVPSGIVGTVSALAYIIRQTREYTNRRLKTEKDQFDSLVATLNSPQSSQDSFLVEQAFEYRFGFPMTFLEIKALRQFPNPTRAISMFRRGKRYLELKNSNFVFRTSVEYRKESRRAIFRYTLFSLLAGGLLAATAPIWLYLKAAGVILELVLIFYCILWAGMHLSVIWGLEDAKRLADRDIA